MIIGSFRRRDAGDHRGNSRTGVDLISVGALTHSARVLDLGLDVVVEG